MTSNSSDSQPTPAPQPVPSNGADQLPAVGVQAGLPAQPFPQSAGPWEGPATDDGINILDYLHSLRRRWLLGVCVGVLLAGVTAVLTWFLVPVTYEAASLLHVRREAGDALKLNVRGSRMDQQEYDSLKATQIAMIESWHVLQDAIDEPGIRSLPMFRGESDKVDYLASILHVSYPDDAEILRISLRGENREDCERVVQAVTTSYRDNVVMAANREDYRRLQFLRGQYSEYEKEIRNLNENIQSSLSEDGNIDSRRTLELLDQIRREISVLRHRQSEIERKTDSTTAEISTLNHFLNSPYMPSRTEIEMALMSNERYVEEEARLNAAKQALENTLARSQPDSRFVLQARENVTMAEQSLQRVYDDLSPTTIEQIRLSRGSHSSQIEAQIDALRGQLRMQQQIHQGVEADIIAKREEMQALLEYNSPLPVLEAELERLKSTTETIKKEIDVLAMNVVQGQRIELLREARTEDHSDIGFKYLIVIGSSVVVFLLSIVGVTLGDYLGKRVNSTNDVAQNIHLPVVGTLPIVHGGWMSHLIPFGKDTLGIKLQESIDSLRTAIVYNRRPTPVRVVMVTSAGSQEGKTTVASQLAVSLARSGRRTLLIDGDFHNPQQHEVFGLGNNTGFCDVLRGEVDPASAALATEAEGLWLMTAGYADRRALQALASPVGREKIEQLKEQFDYIVLDAAPVLTGAEALLLGQFADSALVSIRRDVSRITKVSAACQRLESVGVDILGGILNGAPGEIRRYATVGLEEYEEEDLETVVAEVD